MAQPYRSTCQIDGSKFQCLSIVVNFATSQDHAGMPLMGGLRSAVRVYADYHDQKNLPHAMLSTLFTLANVPTQAKIKPVTLTFWKDDSQQDALCQYQFQGWISGYHTLNPVQGGVATQNGKTGVNHVLILDIQPALNQSNYPSITLTN